VGGGGDGNQERKEASVHALTKSRLEKGGLVGGARWDGGRIRRYTAEGAGSLRWYRGPVKSRIESKYAPVFGGPTGWIDSSGCHVKCGNSLSREGGERKRGTSPALGRLGGRSFFENE